MKQAICTVCATEYPYRKNKIYCSNSCKTKGFQLKKAGEYVTPPTDNVNGQQRRTFYLSDYKLINNEYCSFEEYCFLTKIFYDNENVKDINDYAEKIFMKDNFNVKIENVNSPMGKHFAIFMNEFHSGKFVIKNKRD